MLTTKAKDHRMAQENKTSAYRLPKFGNEDTFEVYKSIQDQLQGNINPLQNFASFVNVSMDYEAIQLILESLNVNLADFSIYSATTEIKKRIIHMVADLLHAQFDPGSDDFIGTATVGSSEAVMLGILAHKNSWFNWYDSLPKNEGPVDGRVPNMVMGAGYQVCWEKVYKYFDIAGLGSDASVFPLDESDLQFKAYDPNEPVRDRCRIIPLEGNRRVVTADKIREAIQSGMIDDNTIAISLILGTTQTGEMDEIIEINEIMRAFNDRREAEAAKLGRKAYRIPIHVDAAYGGFIIPFTESELEWDFRASEVKSINISNHKFGQVLPGLGMVIFRNPSIVPDQLFSKINYLGEQFNDFGLNFSRSSWPIVSQYYNFIRYGYEGYHDWTNQIMQTTEQMTDVFIGTNRYSSYFQLLSETIPASTASDQHQLRFPNIVLQVKPSAPFNAIQLSQELEKEGWYVPAYPLPANLDHTYALRLVIKAHVNEEMVERFSRCLDQAINRLISLV